MAISLLPRIYYTVSWYPVAMDREFRDWKPGGVISCRNCGEVSAGSGSQARALSLREAGLRGVQKLFLKAEASTLSYCVSPSPAHSAGAWR